LIIHIPLYLKGLSYLQPVSLKRSPNDSGVSLELRLYRNRFQLLTADALYSDGDRYYPAVAIVRHLEKVLPSAKSVLVLGAGLGSIVQVMHVRGYDPCFTLVENDKAVLGWALKILGEANPSKLEAVCCDAESFMAQNDRKYDLVFVDLFKGRSVADFVTTPRFLGQCREGLSPCGIVAFNYIEVDPHRWEEVRKTFADIFPGCQTIRREDSRILIGSGQPCGRPRL
jgi:hypothetical protein